MALNEAILTIPDGIPNKCSDYVSKFAAITAATQVPHLPPSPPSPGAGTAARLWVRLGITVLTLSRGRKKHVRLETHQSTPRVKARNLRRDGANQ